MAKLPLAANFNQFKPTQSECLTDRYPQPINILLCIAWMYNFYVYTMSTAVMHTC